MSSIEKERILRGWSCFMKHHSPFRELKIVHLFFQCFLSGACVRIRWAEDSNENGGGSGLFPYFLKHTHHLLLLHQLLWSQRPGYCCSARSLRWITQWGVVLILTKSILFVRVSFTNAAYAQNRVWNMHMPLLTQTGGIYKNQTGQENTPTCARTLTHAYEHFGDGKVPMQTKGGELKSDYGSTSS